MLLHEYSILVNQESLLSTHIFHRSSVVELTLNRVALFWNIIETRKYSKFHCLPKDAELPFVLVYDILVAREKEEHQTNKDGGRKQKVPLYPFTGSRPKRLLVYINPLSGKQLGKRIYEQKVAPLFSQSSISTDVIVTKHANHARDHLEKEADLEQYDGVVCVGGDGMFSEIVHGLLSKTQRDCGVDQNKFGQDLVPCELCIGIIPAGSTDCICYATTGTNDPVTSALHVILGDSQAMDVCSVYHNNTFLRYSTSLLGYGFYGDVLTDSETKRWMGPARYNVSGIKTFLRHRYYEGTVSFVPAKENLEFPRVKIGCRTRCHICERSANRLSVARDWVCKMAEVKSDWEASDDGPWHVIRGTFLAINAASISCACPRSPGGLSPSAHLADGTTDLILVHKASRLGFLQHLIRHTNEDDQFDLPFVEVHRVRQFRFTPKHSNDTSEAERSESGRKEVFNQTCTARPRYSNWTCDGEVLPQAAIQVSVHCQLVKLFARGIECEAQLDPFTLSVIDKFNGDWTELPCVIKRSTPGT